MSVAVERKLDRTQVEKVRAALNAKGIVLDGDTGVFRKNVGIGDVAGSYRYDGTVLRIEVTKKPMLVGWNSIQDQINKGIDEAA